MSDGCGTNSNGEAVVLPETGMNSPIDLIICFTALSMLIAGAYIIYRSRKKLNNQ